MTNTPSSDTGVSKDELKKQILIEFKQVHKLAPADFTENCANVVMSLVQAYANKQAQKEVNRILQKILDNGHGGGNWRRLIIQEMGKELQE